MASTCGSCGKKLGLLDRMGGQQLCDECEDKRARAQQQAHDRLIADARKGILPASPTSPHVMNLAAGEMVHWTVTGAQLMKVSRSYQRTGGGVSIPIGKTGIRTYVGQSRGRVVTTGIEVGDTGTFVLTSKRCIFTGTGTTEILEYRHLLDIKVFQDGLQFHRYNRKTPVIIRLGRGTTETIATLLDVAAQKALGTWQGPAETPQLSTKPELPDSAELVAKRAAVSESFETLSKTFLEAAPPDLFKGLEGRMTPEEVVAQEALRIASFFAASDAVDAPEEVAALADLFGRTLSDDSDETALRRMVQGDRFKTLFKDAPLDGKILFLGSLAARDAIEGTTRSRDVARAGLEFARVICAIDDSTGEEETQLLSRFEGDLRATLSDAGVTWSEEEAKGAPFPDSVHRESVASRDVDAILRDLEQLVGLAAVKSEVGDLVNLLRVQQLKKEQGLPVGEFTHHLVLAGNPGTGKTTVARLLGELLAALKVVPEGQLVEATRADLVAGYSGQTAIKTSEVVDRATGGVLFIDEAYALDQGDQDSFGQEALDTLVKLMEDRRHELAVFAAGYTDRMEQFIDANPGLASRFKRTLLFEDYSVDELVAICRVVAARDGYEVPEETLARFRQAIEGLGAEHGTGNARLVRRLFEAAVIRQANRLAAVEHPSKEELVLLLPEDVGEPARTHVARQDEGNAANAGIVRGGPRSLVSVNVAGRQVPDGVAAVAEYVGQHLGTVRQYDLIGPGDPNVLTRYEVVRTRVIASRISEEEADWFVATAATAPWAQVAPDLDLRVCDAAVVDAEYDAAEALYMHFFGQRPKSVSIGKVHKVLHIKRPHLYPILDSRLRQLYLPLAREAASQLKQRSKRWSGTREHFWEAIRVDLVRNSESLNDVRAQLEGAGDDAALAASLSDLRLLDLLTWPLAS